MAERIALQVNGESRQAKAGLSLQQPVSYTHLTLPTNREV